MTEERPCVYILASRRNGTLYVGVTSDLARRAWEHRSDVADGFVQRYGVHMLVFAEFHATMADAINGSPLSTSRLFSDRYKRWCETISACFWRLGMTFSARAEMADIRVKAVAIGDDELSVTLMDGRRIAVPLAWFPRLAAATPAQREHWEVAGGGYGLHWPEIDEDLSTEGLLLGARAPRDSGTRRATPTA